MIGRTIMVPTSAHKRKVAALMVGEPVKNASGEKLGSVIAAIYDPDKDSIVIDVRDDKGNLVYGVLYI